ncbi:MAG: methylated-DNA--[protein]-cysteine S-methyltransferase [Betaproteobacteria bacterium]|jgi:methylated-DNA-[protein]-cysteine S-methyltransferase|nr:methylated-DNA--[protein]-cysteine S-methyltransferase [Pseudomonadota bacterium]NBO04510.1 methylated-DNA--[protein]-cysteine S-methyltransferase [Betaproteobacteria bacterium]HAB48750.1 cysteine methyltransferase [Lautropia sp.]NBO96453.1 methylated-DNA--[protein]-cysteine S-methyltransferase [Betaproteobacteria bacterium]NBP35384.1 methylated-DNA--[protein]-cysteine S-methyltransferase [Betaproteobacteria bacterium]
MKFDHIRAAKRISSPLGDIVLAASDSGLCGLWFEGQKHQPQLDGKLFVVCSHALAQAEAQVNAWFRGELNHFQMRLDLSAGTSFQQAVWRALQDIPIGQTRSYSAISQQIDQAGASRAVGAAIGRNPISLIVPCHRVLGASGGLTGYAGGLERKIALLEREGAPCKSTHR